MTIPSIQYIQYSSQDVSRVYGIEWHLEKYADLARKHGLVVDVIRLQGTECSDHSSEFRPVLITWKSQVAGVQNKLCSGEGGRGHHPPTTPLGLAYWVPLYLTTFCLWCGTYFSITSGQQYRIPSCCLQNGVTYFLCLPLWISENTLFCVHLLNLLN